VKRLQGDAIFDSKNPNKIRSLIGVFSRNLVRFHDVTGAGYRFIADWIIEVDRFNPIVASRLAEAFQKFARLDAARKPLMKREITRILSSKKLSRDVYEITSKILASGDESSPP